MDINATILGQAISFFLFTLFCMKYIWPPLIDSINKRQKEIADSLATAKLARQELDIAQSEASNCLKQAKIKAQEIIEQANKHKHESIHQAKTTAMLERNKILLQTQIDIETERKRACEELRKHLALLAFNIAEKIIEHSIDKNINNKIIDNVINNLNKTNSKLT